LTPAPSGARAALARLARVAAYLGHANARVTEEIHTGLFNHDAASDMDALGALDRRSMPADNVRPLRLAQ
jgi:hypothetical protein